jgi:hypothetical protein
MQIKIDPVEFAKIARPAYEAQLLISPLPQELDFLYNRIRDRVTEQIKPIFDRELSKSNLTKTHAEFVKSRTEAPKP